MDDGLRDLLHRGNDIAHLLVGGAWLGSLVPLLPCLSALRRPDLRADGAIALRGFSTAGHGAVALVLAAGMINALLVAGPPAHWLAPSLYHGLLLAKIALVACMVALAVINRYVWVPRMKANPDTATRAIVAGTIGEDCFSVSACWRWWRCSDGSIPAGGEPRAPSQSRCVCASGRDDGQRAAAMRIRRLPRVSDRGESHFENFPFKSRRVSIKPRAG